MALLTAVPCHAGESEADRASRSVNALALKPSLVRYFDGLVETPSLFDQTSVNLAVWLPRSDALGGEACIFPTYPVHPLPAASS